MAYSDDAMIAVITKVESAHRAKLPGNQVQDLLEGTDEHDCYKIAVSKKYFGVDAHCNHLWFAHATHIELDRLVEAKNNKQREIARGNRETLHIVLLIISIVIAACALWISALNRYRSLVPEHPVGIMGTIEILPDQTPTTTDSDEYPDASKADSETDTDIHEH